MRSTYLSPWSHNPTFFIAINRSQISSNSNLFLYILSYTSIPRNILPHPLPLIQPHFISDHRNELAVRRFSPQVMDGIAEVAVEGVHITPVPCHLDGVADGALHPAGGGAVFLGDFRVQALGHSVDILRLVHGEQDGIPQELVALDMGRHGIRVGNKSKSKSYYLLV